MTDFAEPEPTAESGRSVEPAPGDEPGLGGEAEPTAATERQFELGSDGPSLILVGVDGSRTSLRAAAYAAGVGRRQRAPLLVVYVARPAMATGTVGQVSAAWMETSRQIAEEIQQLIDDNRERVGVPVEFITVEGDPWRELSRIAEERRVDLVVIGASEAAGHRLVGSLAARFVRAGRWPVTVVP